MTTRVFEPYAPDDLDRRGAPKLGQGAPNPAIRLEGRQQKGDLVVGLASIVASILIAPIAAVVRRPTERINSASERGSCMTAARRWRSRLR